MVYRTISKVVQPEKNIKIKIKRNSASVLWPNGRLEKEKQPLDCELYVFLNKKNPLMAYLHI